MEWQYLEYFRVAARLQHMTRAAETLGLTQPALTRAIFRLERDLGVPLFHHVGRTTELTAYGHAFVPRVERALNELNEAKREFADLSGREREQILLGSLRTLGAECVPRILREFCAAYPSARVTLSQGRPPELLRELESGDVRLALMDDPESAPVEWRRVFDQEMVVIVPLAHRFAERHEIRLDDLAGEPFVCYERSSAIGKLVAQLCAQAGFTPNVCIEGQYSSNVRGLVAAGVGIALVPAMGNEWQLPTLRIHDTSARRAIGIAWFANRYLTQAERNFREFVLASAPLPLNALVP